MPEGELKNNEYFKVPNPCMETDRYLAKAEVKADTKSNTAKLKQDLKEKQELLKELPEATYKFDLSSSTPEKEDKVPESLAILNREYAKADETKDFNITITGTADKTLFKLDESSAKPRVKLNYGKKWVDKHLGALKNLQALNTIPELAGLDFDKKGIYAIYKLPLADQQKVMNHALAYLRAEKLKIDLEKKFNHPNVKFTLQTDWSLKSTKRISNIIDLNYEKKVIEPPAPPKPPKPPEEPPEPKIPDVIGEIETLENAKYKVSRTATMKETVWGMDKTKTMNAGEIKGLQVLYVIEKSNPENPKYFIAYDPKDPFEVNIGKIKYTNYLLKTSATTETVDKLIPLDKKNIKKSLQDVLNQIPY